MNFTSSNQLPVTWFRLQMVTFVLESFQWNYLFVYLNEDENAESVGLSFAEEKKHYFDCFTYIHRGKKHIVQWLSGRFQLCHCS